MDRNSGSHRVVGTRGLRAGSRSGDDEPVIPPPIVGDDGGGAVGEDGTDPDEEPKCVSCGELDQNELGRIDLREVYPDNKGVAAVHLYGAVLCKNCLNEVHLTWKFLTADLGVVN